MFKCKLQEFCQKRAWDMPVYTSIKHGLSHNPRFTATVTVYGVTFDTPEDKCRSSKEAQNLAAQRAYDHFTGLRTIQPQPQPQSETPFPGSSLVSTHTDQIELESKMGEISLACGNAEKPKDVLDLYKNKLQNYALKHLLKLPAYEYEYNGPPNAHKFKAKVTFCGKTYESPEFLSTIKDAEVAAEKVAFDALPSDDTVEDERLYKNLLQEIQAYMDIDYPSYITKISGPPHMPTFIATVEIACEVFQGEEASTKKQAEIKAAKVAYNAITERRDRLFSSCNGSVDAYELFQTMYPNAHLFGNKKMNTDIQDAISSSEEVNAPCDTGSQSMGLKNPKDVLIGWYLNTRNQI